MIPPRWIKLDGPHPIPGDMQHCRFGFTVNWRDWDLYREMRGPWTLSTWLRLRWFWLKAQFGWKPGGPHG